MSASNVPSHPGVDILSERRAWAGQYSNLDLITFRHTRFDGIPSAARTWELFRRGRAAALLPFDPWTDTVVLIEQFRLPALAGGVAPVMVEIPAGLCDAGEDPVDTVRRELREETGVGCDRIETIGDFLLSPGGSDERCAMFAGRVHAPSVDADGLSGRFGLSSEDEDIRVRVWPADRAVAAAIAGDFPNSVTTIALLWLAARRQSLRTAWTAP